MFIRRLSARTRGDRSPINADVRRVIIKLNEMGKR